MFEKGICRLADEGVKGDVGGVMGDKSECIGEHIGSESVRFQHSKDVRSPVFMQKGAEI